MENKKESNAADFLLLIALVFASLTLGFEVGLGHQTINANTYCLEQK